MNDKTFKAPNIFPNNYGVNTLNNVIVFDLEPDGIIYNSSTNPDEIFVPNIKEWSFVHIPNFKSGPIDITNKVCHITNYSYADTINVFCKEYKRLNYPVIMAHNGNRFDFLVLIASVYRYLHNAEDIVKRFTYFDTYLHIKKLKYNKKSNLDMFLRHVYCYKSYANLQYKQHNSLEDCQMLTLWFSVITKKINNVVFAGTGISQIPQIQTQNYIPAVNKSVILH